MADVNLLLLWNDDGGDEGDVDNVDTSLQNSRDAAGVSPVETSGNGMNETTSEREREEGDKESSSLSDKTMHPQKDKQEVETGLTVLITSYKQPTCLNRLIRHYQTCDIVHSININHFHDNHTLPPIYAYAKNTTKPVVYTKVPNSLNYRFYPRPISTTAILHTDVDWTYSCELLEYAMTIYRQEQRLQHQQNSHNNSTSLWKNTDPKDVDNIVVGFHPRNLHSHGAGFRGGYPFYEWKESFLPPFSYNTLWITMGAITHPNVLQAYFRDDRDHKPKSLRVLRDKVGNYTTAEDMLMSFILAKYMQGKFFFVCPDPKHWCESQCQENKVPALSSTTASHRSPMLYQCFRHFGADALVDADAADNNNTHHNGNNQVHWQAGIEQDECLPQGCVHVDTVFENKQYDKRNRYKKPKQTKDELVVETQQ